MPNVLTEAATIACGHIAPGLGGRVMIKKDPQVKLTVQKSTVLTENALKGQPVSSLECGTVPATAPAPISIQCKTCTKITSSQTTKLTVHGQAVLLAPLAGETDGTVANVKPQTLLNATGVQTKLSAV